MFGVGLGEGGPGALNPPPGEAILSRSAHSGRVAPGPRGDVDHSLTGSTMAIPETQRKQIIEEYRTHDGDTGSPEVQVALLTANIKAMTEHLKQHKHDFSSRRGLMGMVSRRRRLTGYLQKTDRQRYQNLIQRLGLRH